MKNIILHLLLFLSVTTFAADDIILSEGLSFQYVYLETNEPYSSHGELMTKFYNECIKQNLEEYIVGKMLTIYFDDDIPEWRIAFEINQNVLLVFLFLDEASRKYAFFLVRQLKSLFFK